MTKMNKDEIKQMLDALSKDELKIVFKDVLSTILSNEQLAHIMLRITIKDMLDLMQLGLEEKWDEATDFFNSLADRPILQ